MADEEIVWGQACVMSAQRALSLALLAVEYWVPRHPAEHNEFRAAAEKLRELRLEFAGVEAGGKAADCEHF